MAAKFIQTLHFIDFLFNPHVIISTPFIASSVISAIPFFPSSLLCLFPLSTFFSISLPISFFLPFPAYIQWRPMVTATRDNTPNVVFQLGPAGPATWLAPEELVLSASDSPEIVSAVFRLPSLLPLLLLNVYVSPEITVTSAAAVCSHTDCRPVNPHWLYVTESSDAVYPVAAVSVVMAVVCGSAVEMVLVPRLAPRLAAVSSVNAVCVTSCVCVLSISVSAVSAVSLVSVLAFVWVFSVFWVFSVVVAALVSVVA